MTNTIVTKQEARHVLFRYSYEGGEQGGGFTQSLLRAIEQADPDNLERLRLGFPGYVAAMKEWYPSDLQARLKEED